MRRNLVSVNYGRFGPPTNQFLKSNQVSQIEQIQSVYQVNPVLSNVINTQPVFYSAPPLSHPPFPSLSFASQFPAFPQPQQLQPQTYYSGPPNMPPQPMLLHMPMPIQQVEEKTIVESMHQNFDGNRNNISFPKSQIDQEFNKAGFSKQHYDIRYNLAQNAYGANSLNFVFVQRQNVFPQHLCAIEQPNHKVQNSFSPIPMLNPHAMNYGVLGYPTLSQTSAVVSQVVGAYNPSPQTPVTLRTEVSTVALATLAGNTPSTELKKRIRREFNLSLLPRNLFSQDCPSYHQH